MRQDYNMPKGVVKTKHEEELWDRAKEAVSRNEYTPEKKFTDEHWEKVNALFQKLKPKKEK